MSWIRSEMEEVPEVDEQEPVAAMPADDDPETQIGEELAEDPLADVDVDAGMDEVDEVELEPEDG